MMPTVVSMLSWAALLLSLERFFYVWLCESPRSFVRLCRNPWSKAALDPVDVVEVLFGAFKMLQAGVFVWWCLVFGRGQLFPLAAGPAAILSGALLITGGQALILIAFRRLGRLTAFYGGQFGRPVRWNSGFPFSWFRHPQYVGAVASIWGVMLIFRFPAPDWWWLPALQTIYYGLGARLERYDPARSLKTRVTSRWSGRLRSLSPRARQTWHRDSS